MRLSIAQIKPVDSEVVNWLIDGYHPRSKDYVEDFLKHLVTWHQVSANPVDGFIFLEENHQLADDFSTKIQQVVEKLPHDYDVCLLSYLPTSWDDIKYIPKTDQLLCTISSKVYGSYAYFIRSYHLQRLLGIFNRPLREIPGFEFNDQTLTRCGRVCMINKPIVACFKNDNLTRYFNKIGFHSNE